MTEWYYADAAQQRHGPLAAADLQQRFQRSEIGLSTLVWREGLSEWRTLAEFVDELGLAQAPPPAPALAPMEVGGEVPPPAPTPAVPDAWASPAPPAVASPYAAPSAVLDGGARVVGGGEVVQAGFWKRVAAYLIDAFLVGMVANVIQFVVLLGFMGVSGVGNQPNFTSAAGIVMLLLMYLMPIAISALYYGLFHASTKQATLGKMAVGIKVVRTDGSRITVARGVGRYFGFMLSSLTLGIGLLMAAFTERKQALHDMLCDTLVVDKWAYTDHPEWQQRKLGTVTVVILSLFGLLMAGVVLLVALAIGMAAKGGWH
ncbi:RDD family protein [Xanthomonas sp. CFBP 8445]|uniref:RDD family protein n=1 Tax=Xanthomonas sp. CFBP 8445 TaxID=2971236 RepID=UPI0021DF76B1|nr:RDD family protein [Xanthomonas sp. CFBP 8445]UYC12815.1 RDD family protein [Xanthomonas sp. CFBP 8445]